MGLGVFVQMREGKTNFGRIQNLIKFDQNRTFRVAVAEDGDTPGRWANLPTGSDDTAD